MSTFYLPFYFLTCSILLCVHLLSQCSPTWCIRTLQLACTEKQPPCTFLFFFCLWFYSCIIFFTSRENRKCEWVKWAPVEPLIWEVRSQSKLQLHASSPVHHFHVVICSDAVICGARCEFETVYVNARMIFTASACRKSFYVEYKPNLMYTIGAPHLLLDLL